MWSLEYFLGGGVSSGLFLAEELVWDKFEETWKADPDWKPKGTKTHVTG